MGAVFIDAQLSNLISIEGADFTDVSALSSESAEYVGSIASGNHPETFRQTPRTLRNISASDPAAGDVSRFSFAADVSQA